jgi:plasmid stabilization system protein ParE
MILKYQLVNRPSVEKDIMEAVDYYKNISPELAHRFLFRIREAKSFIAQYPLGFQEKYKNIRTVLLKQFPYQIHYLIDDLDQNIIILAIIHAYKNPMDYSNR